MNPSGHVAIVTGGGSGLGEATARTLAANGARVAVLDVGIERAEKVAAEIGGIAITCDVSSAESGEAAVAEVAARIGEPRILVNCAGIAIGVKTLGKDGPHPLDSYRKVIEVNLIGTFNMIRLVADRTQKLEPLASGERGVIVNTASVAAFDGQIGQAAYSSSKGGVVGMTLPVARDLARSGIRVVTIAPGIFKTADDERHAAGGSGFAWRCGSVSVAAWRAVGICRTRAPHHREPDAQWRDDPSRRRHPHGAEISRDG